MTVPNQAINVNFVMFTFSLVFQLASQFTTSHQSPGMAIIPYQTDSVFHCKDQRTRLPGVLYLPFFTCYLKEPCQLLRTASPGAGGQRSGVFSATELVAGTRAEGGAVVQQDQLQAPGVLNGPRGSIPPGFTVAVVVVLRQRGLVQA